ncbi:histamine transporter isoform X2 [Rhynchophorus ferrugineus]|uniref:histamine transporter isoform X2 n=1 Tax=Rhynchophorus ferrugineus TaxID=354439 RepID=UPI003FCE0918
MCDKGSGPNYETMSSSVPDLESKGTTLPDIEKPKVYPIRWFILILFVLFSASNAMQWIQYAIINTTIIDYYGVSSDWVNWTSLIFMVLYIPFIFPASYLLEKLGMRLAITIGIFGTCLGSWIKVASVSPDRFYVSFIGQACVGLSQVFVLSVPARLAAIWFGPDQVSSACSIGVFGNQIGIAAGFVIPPMIVRQGSVDDVTRQLYILFIGVAILTSILLVLIIFFFKSAPPTPPSYAAQQQSGEEVSFVQSLKNLLKNRSFIFLLLSYGINVGVFYAISTLLNDIITFYYKGADQDAGRIGLVITVAGMVGSVCCGYVLDRYRKYKETTIVVYAFSLLGMIALTFTISQGLWVAYLVAGFLGFFMTGLLPVGFELGSELTYPEPEGTQAGLLNAGSQIFGIAFTNIYSPIFKNVSPLWANIAMCVALAVGLFLVSSVSSHLKRQAALNSSK